MDRSREDGAHLHIQISIGNSDRNATIETIIGGQYGMCGRESTPAIIRAIHDELNKLINELKRDFITGINDDVSNTMIIKHHSI